MLPEQIARFVLGGLTMGCLVASVFFVRYYRDSRDRLFLFFAAAFLLEGIDRAVFAFSTNPKEGDPVLYWIRAVAYSLILIGIWDKNRKRV